MKAFLLVAGLGTRLRPLTNVIPKCLLPIGGKPLLQIWLDNMERHGIDQVVVNTHWLHEKVESFLKGRKNGGLKVICHHEPRLLGSAGTLKAHEHWISDDEPFLILYGDNYTNVNLSGIASFHRSHDLPFTLGVFKTLHPDRCGIAEITDDGLVTDFVEKPRSPKSDLAAAGVYVADRRIFDFFPIQGATQEESLDLGFHVIPKLIGRMKAYFIEEFLIDIGTPQSYESALKLWASIQVQKENRKAAATR